VRVEGEADEVLLTATRSPDGDLTLYALNRAAEPRRIALAGLPTKPAHLLVWNPKGDGKLAPAIGLIVSDAAMPLLLPSESVVAITLVAGRR
jgi:hypothetical protein